MDALSNEQDGRIALKLFGRFGFSTDAPDEWAAYADPLLTVHRAGGAGVSWTAERWKAEELSTRFELGPVRSGQSPRVTCSPTSAAMASSR